jgi:hypothetical protein
MIRGRRIRWVGHVARTVEMSIPYKILVGKLGGKRPLGRPRCRWEDNIKWILWKKGWRVRVGFIWLRLGIGGGLL